LVREKKSGTTVKNKFEPPWDEVTAKKKKLDQRADHCEEKKRNKCRRGSFSKGFNIRAWGKEKTSKARERELSEGKGKNHEKTRHHGYW